MSEQETAKATTLEDGGIDDWEVHQDTKSGRSYYFSKSRKQSAWVRPPGAKANASSATAAPVPSIEPTSSTATSTASGSVKAPPGTFKAKMAAKKIANAKRKKQLSMASAVRPSSGVWDWEEKYDPKHKRKYWWSKSRNKSVWIKPKERSSGGSFKVREKKASSADKVEKMERVETGANSSTISESHASTYEGQSTSKEEQVNEDEDDGDWIECFDEKSKRKYWFDRKRRRSSWVPPKKSSVGKKKTLGALGALGAGATEQASMSAGGAGALGGLSTMAKLSQESPNSGVLGGTSALAGAAKEAQANTIEEGEGLKEAKEAGVSEGESSTLVTTKTGNGQDLVSNVSDRSTEGSARSVSSQSSASSVDDWEEHVDPNSQATYFYSRSRKSSSWTRPEQKKKSGLPKKGLGALSGLARKSEEGDDGDNGGDGAVLGGSGRADIDARIASGNSARAAMEQTLAEGTVKIMPDGIVDDWQAHIDPTSKATYYYSPARGKSVWVDPHGAAAVALDAAATSSRASQRNGVMGDLRAAAEKRNAARKVEDHVSEGVGYGTGEIDSDDETDIVRNYATSGGRFRASTSFGGYHDYQSNFYDEELNSQPPSYQGYLSKEGGGRSWFGQKSWKKRWAIISGVRLGIFKSQEAYAAGNQPIKNRWVNLEEYRVEKALLEVDGIRLVPCFPHLRVWKFKAGDMRKRDLWIEAFGKVTKVGMVSELQDSLSAGLAAIKSGRNLRPSVFKRS